MKKSSFLANGAEGERLWRTTKRLFHQLETSTRLTYILLSILLVLTVGAADFFSGDEISILIFYLLPVSVSAWFAGRGVGAVISIFSARSAWPQFWRPINRQKPGGYALRSLPRSRVSPITFSRMI